MVTLDNVSKRYGTHVALHPTTFEFERGNTTVLIGPSGCGKSTLLRMVIGLIRPDSGVVRIDGKALHPDSIERVRHGIGYVIQEGGLFPHLTAAANITLLARHLGQSPDQISKRVGWLCELLGVSDAQLGRYPQELSGGQRQRIGLMRALMLDPPLLLLDEPLAALDPVTRHALQDELKQIFEMLGKTVVLVTHDMAEAAHFAKTIVMLHGGRVVHCGTLQELLRQPADSYVHDFLHARRSIPERSS